MENMFRGKTTKGEWVYGDLIHPSSNHVVGCCPSPIEDKFSFILTKCWVNGGRLGTNGVKWVLSETVGQNSGIKDKKGKYIYTGDFIKIPDDYKNYGLNAGEIYEVYFAYGGFRMKPKYRKEAKGFWLEDDGEFKIIGNKYDHPKILEE